MLNFDTLVVSDFVVRLDGCLVEVKAGELVKHFACFAIVNVHVLQEAESFDLLSSR